MKFLLFAVFNFKDYSGRPEEPPTRICASAKVAITTNGSRRLTKKMIDHRLRLLECQARKTLPSTKNTLLRSVSWTVAEVK